MTQLTMNALIIESANAPFKLTQLARPVVQQGQALVKIKASGVNPLDTKIRAGVAAHARQPLPAVLGMDLAGTVEAVGPGVTSVRVGDDVYGLAGGIGGLQGTLAEYVAVDAELLAIKPHNLSMREAAALPLAVVTAWEGLIDRAKVQAHQSVLIHGGAGGVGSVAVQIALAQGAKVYATGSAAQKSTIEALVPWPSTTTHSPWMNTWAAIPVVTGLTWSTTQWEARCSTARLRPCANTAGTS